MQHTGHISLDISRDQLLSMATLVRAAVMRSLKSLYEEDILLARRIVDEDKTINSYEIDIDNSTFNFLALTAKDLPDPTLRQVLAIQKINAMLERIGDHAVNIAESAETKGKKFKGLRLYRLPDMGNMAIGVLKDAVTSFFEQNAGLAQEVLSRDDAIDGLNIQITNEVKVDVMAGRLDFEAALEIIRIAKNLERIADLASNIAEEVSFMVQGTIIKHQFVSTEMKPIEYEIIKTNASMVCLG